MKREARLRAAPKFLRAYSGRRIVCGYARWFGVDRTCAILELRRLGVAVPFEEEKAALDALAAAQARNRRRREPKIAPASYAFDDLLKESSDVALDSWAGVDEDAVPHEREDDVPC